MQRANWCRLPCPNHLPAFCLGALPAGGLSFHAVHPSCALLPLLVVGLGNLALTLLIPRITGGAETVSIRLAGLPGPVTAKVAQQAALWAVEGALLLGIATILIFAFPVVARRFAEGSKAAVGGALLAGMNTAVEYGFGGVIAALPGFLVVKDAEGGAQPADQRSDYGDDAGRHHRIGVGRPVDRAGGDGGPVRGGGR
jgi:H+/gluconate symporter-like permease